MLAANRQAPDAETISLLMKIWQNGGIKLWLIERILRIRQTLPALFLESSYVALSPSGAAADRICAFARQSGKTWLFVAAALRPAQEDRLWEDTMIALPPALRVPNGEMFSMA